MAVAFRQLFVSTVPGKRSPSLSAARGELSAGDGVGSAAAHSEGPRLSLGCRINCYAKAKVSAGPCRFAGVIQLNRAGDRAWGSPPWPVMNSAITISSLSSLLLSSAVFSVGSRCPLKRHISTSEEKHIHFF